MSESLSRKEKKEAAKLQQAKQIIESHSEFDCDCDLCMHNLQERTSQQKKSLSTGVIPKDIAREIERKRVQDLHEKKKK
jgi:hypothetical protein